MKIAVVGAGIAGNVVAHHLRQAHDITVFEAGAHVGGHTNTVEVEDQGLGVPVDTGFIVFNDRTYPNFMALLDTLGQTYRQSVMSFSVQNERSGLEYCGSSLGGLFAQRRNLINPVFLGMVREILRFNREAVGAAAALGDDVTVGHYLDARQYSEAFAEDYLVPMSAAIWSAEPQRVRNLPLKFLVQFFDNHGLLQLRDRPTWYTIEGGSEAYVDKLVAGHRESIRLSTPVESVSRLGDHVQVKARGCQPEQFDYVFIACHSDQALAMLSDPTDAEKEVLGAIPYQANEAVLHTDISLLPRQQKAWAAWNYHAPGAAQQAVAVTYNMNILQGLNTREVYCVTLNASERVDPAKILYSVTYEHPVFSLRATAAQGRQAELNRGRRTAYCGAYWRNGFHEDGVVSALEALRHFDKEHGREQLPVRRAG